MKNLLLFLILAGGFAIACEADKEAPSNPLAKVKDKFLYRSDFDKWLKENNLTKDSSYLDEYIETWLFQQILIDEALEANLDRFIQQKVAAYRNKLLVYEYQEKYIQENLDTLVTAADVQEYFETNKTNLKLRNHLVKGFIIKIDKTKRATIRTLKTYIRRSSATEIAPNLIQEVIKTADDYRFFTEQWTKFKELYFIMPELSKYNIPNFIRNAKLQTYQNDDYTFLIQIYDSKLLGDTPPFNFVEPLIINNILSQRKINLIEKLKRDILNLQQDNYEVY